MKRIFACLLAAALLLACAGCGTKKSGESGEEKTLTGTLDEVKDFMFVVTDDNGDSYALTFEGGAPEGLAEQEVGDRVTVQVNDSYGYDVIIRAIQPGEDTGEAPLVGF